MDTSAEEILLNLIALLEFYLDELTAMEQTSFVRGQRHAFVECLEVIQEWEKAASAGLDYDIEKKYPL